MDVVQWLQFLGEFFPTAIHTENKAVTFVPWKLIQAYHYGFQSTQLTNYIQKFEDLPSLKIMIKI